MSTASLVPLQIFEWNKPFFDAASAGSIRVSRCAACGHCDGLPQISCSECSSFEREWVESDGLGRIYSWTETFYSFHPAFADVPFTVALVDLIDIPQVRLACMAASGVGADGVEIGARVRCAFGDVVNVAGAPILTFLPEGSEG